MFFVKAFVFLLSSSLSISLIYFKVSIQNFQQIIALVLVILLLFLSRFVFAKSKIGFSKKNQIILLFLTCFLVQLLVLSTGSFYGPLLILLHLYSLAVAFLLNIALSVVFLTFSVSVLAGQILLDEKMLQFFKSDPATVILYGVSFLIIIPLGWYLANVYRIKDTLSTLLSEYLHLGKAREESILSGLNELVFITDKMLNIISVSEAVGKTLQLSSSEVIDHPLLNILPIKDSHGKVLILEELPIRNVLADKAGRLVKDLYINVPLGDQLLRVVVQIKPIISSKGEINQLVFIISDARLFEDTYQYHPTLQESLIRHQKLVEEIKKGLALANLPDLKKSIEILNHVEEDLITALEMEDHPFKEKISFEDVAYVGEQIVSKKRELAQSLGVTLEFILPKEEVSEASLLHLKQSNVSEDIFGESDFSIPIDGRWLKLMIQKLVDVAILLSSGGRMPKVTLAVNRGNENIDIIVSGTNPGLSQKQAQNILLEPLSLGSGMEGLIAKMVADRLKIPIVIKVDDKVSFLIRFNKKPK